MIEFFEGIPENTRRGLEWSAITNLNNTIIGNMQQHIRITTGTPAGPEDRGNWDENDSENTIDKYNDQCAAEDASDMNAYQSWAMGLADQFREDGNFVMTQYNEETGLNEEVSETLKPGVEAKNMSIYMHRCIQLHSLRTYFLDRLAKTSKDPDDTLKRLTYRSSIEWRLNAPRKAKYKDEVYEGIIKQMDLEGSITAEQMQTGAAIRADRDKQIFKDIADQLIYKLEKLTEYACDTGEHADVLFENLPIVMQHKFLKSMFGGIAKQEVNICLQMADGYFDNMPNLPILKEIRKDVEKEMRNLDKRIRPGSDQERARELADS